MNLAVAHIHNEAVIATWQFHKNLHVLTLGGNRDALHQALIATKTAGLSLSTVIQPPSSPRGIGFKAIVPLQPEGTFGDGVLVPDRTAVAMQSRDCPIVVMYNMYNGKTVLCHAGRPALSRRDEHDGTILDAACNAIGRQSHERSYIKAYVTAGICQHCFVHEGPDAESFLTPFRKHHPQAIDDWGGLDLRMVITSELVGLGVEATNIVCETTCTKEHPALTSHRNGDMKSNLVLVLQH